MKMTNNELKTLLTDTLGGQLPKRVNKSNLVDVIIEAENKHNSKEAPLSRAPIRQPLQAISITQ